MDIATNQDEVEYLYHYTSIESLALILKNHTIRLNPLNKMDDLQEQRTQDVENFGQYFFASSWTDEERESIPMWKMYTNTSAGVRIKLRKNPFKRQKTNINKFSKLTNAIVDNTEPNQEEVDTLLDISELVNKKVFSADACHGNILHKVIYTRDKSLLEPKVCSQDNGDINLSYDTMGKYKNIHWEFQKEWRYLMSFIPFDLRGTTEESYKKFLMTGQKIVQGKEVMPISFVDLEILNEYFDEMEITPSPQMSAGYRVVLDSLVEKYNPKAVIKESELLGLI